MGDRITVYTDLKGNARVLLVDNRRVSGPLYWNVSRNYANGETGRKPNADGYYVIDLIADGKIVHVKTKDKDMASKIDAETGGFTLMLKNGVVQNKFPPTVAKGMQWYGVGAYDAMEINGKTVTAVRNRPQASDFGATSIVDLADDCKIIDVDSKSATYGQITELKLGDRITTYRTKEGKAGLCLHYQPQHP